MSILFIGPGADPGSPLLTHSHINQPKSQILELMFKGQQQDSAAKSWMSVMFVEVVGKLLVRGGWLFITIV